MNDGSWDIGRRRTKLTVEEVRGKVLSTISHSLEEMLK
jgi:hypothetical protein